MKYEITVNARISARGAYFVYQFFASKWHYLYFQLTQTVTNNNKKQAIGSNVLWGTW